MLARKPGASVSGRSGYISVPVLRSWAAGTSVPTMASNRSPPPPFWRQLFAASDDNFDGTILRNFSESKATEGREGRELNSSNWGIQLPEYKQHNCGTTRRHRYLILYYFNRWINFISLSWSSKFYITRLCTDLLYIVLYYSTLGLHLFFINPLLSLHTGALLFSDRAYDTLMRFLPNLFLWWPGFVWVKKIRSLKNLYEATGKKIVIMGSKNFFTHPV